MSTTTLFNECLVIERILLFVDFHDWPLLQPYRVSTKWSEVFRSESFAENYLHALFSLTSAQQSKLRTTIQYFANVGGNGEEGFTKASSSNKEKIKNKKEKLKTATCTPCVPYTTYWHVLKQFIVSSLRFSLTARPMLETCLKDQQCVDAVNLLIELSLLEKREREVRSLFTNFFNSRLIMDEDNEEKYVPAIVMQQLLCGPMRGVFLRSASTRKESRFNSDVSLVVFLNYGFPVELRCEFKYDSNSYDINIWESVTLFNCLLFHNNTQSSRMEEFIEPTVNFLKERLLHDPDMELIPDGLDKDVTFNTVLYHWFFNGFLECSDHMLDYKAQNDENDVIQWRAYLQKESNNEDESDIEESMEKEKSDTEESMDKKKVSSKKRKTQVESDEESLEEEEYYEKEPKKPKKKKEESEEDE